MTDIEQSVLIRAEMLDKSQWASEFPWKEIEILARYLAISRIAPGTTIFQEGTIGKRMCILVDGSVNVVKNDAHGHHKVLTAITTGKAFGEMTLFDGEPRSASVLAAGPTTLLVLTKENLDQLLDDHPRLGAKLLFKLGKVISQRLRMTTGQLVNLI
ncbi:MAG: Crp/Fnr family transcriptional regulator [Syntrophales bacterium]